MNIFDPTFIRDICDHSFGDHPGLSFFNGYMNPANLNNTTFMNKYKSLKDKKKYMTLFIDSIRLYNRTGIKYSAVELVNEESRKYKDKVVVEYFRENDLLKLCSQLPDMKFIIFCFFDDTPIDEFIFDKIPENVIKIYAANAIDFGGKVVPVPYGVQRRLYPNDNRQEVLKHFIDSDIKPTKLLYMNHNVGNNPNRIKINSFFIDKNWATVGNPNGIGNYVNYLLEIKNHKFMICPDGNAIGCECHRDWEVIYMRRVPVVIRSRYLERIFDGFPVLMVNDFSEVTEELLISNEHLYQEALSLDMRKLDIKIFYDKIIEETEKTIS